MLTDNFEHTMINVDKIKLLETLRVNRKAHDEEFEKTKAAYREAVVVELRAMLLEIASGKEPRNSTGLKSPVSHTKDYDLAIDMLEWSTAEQIVVSSGQFRMYVRDEWGWKEEFKINSIRYLGG